jgi:hypothetical protein
MLRQESSDIRLYSEEFSIPISWLSSIYVNQNPIRISDKAKIEIQLKSYYGTNENFTVLYQEQYLDNINDVLATRVYFMVSTLKAS